MDSISKIIEYIDKNFSEKRRVHTYGVRDTAIKLAEKYGCDKEKAEIAALLHDMYRGVAVSVLNYHVKHLGLDKRYIDNPNLSHGKIAAEMIKKDFNIDDEDIINAVSFHTTGRSHMSLLEKIIYIADLIEEGRKFPVVDTLRELAYGGKLDEALLTSFNNTLMFVINKKEEIHPRTVMARNYLIKEKLL